MTICYANNLQST